MRRKYQKDDPVWRKAFGDTLKKIIILYSLDYHDFCNNHNISDATFRYWLLGSKLPQLQYMEEIKKFLYDDKLNDPVKIQELHNYIAEFMSTQGAEEIFFAFKRKYPEGKTFAGEILAYYRNIAKHKTTLKIYFDGNAVPIGKTQAIVFDFDGTLTKDKLNRTTWESIWVDLGYSERDCQELHQRYNRKEICHAEWCRITEKNLRSGTYTRKKSKKLHQRSI